MLREIENERKNAPHGMTQARLTPYAESYGLSLDALYTRLRKFRGRVKKGGGRKKTYPQEIFDEYARRKMKAWKFAAEEYKTAAIRRDLLAEGYDESELPSDSHVNAHLRADGFRLQGFSRMIEAAFGNEHCELDFTRSLCFQLKDYDEKAEDWLLIARTRELSYKANNKKLRTWLAVYKDSYSRLLLAKAYPASGESTLMGIDMLDFAFNRPQDGHPLRYVPWALQTDRGAVARSEPYQRAMQALEIDAQLAQSKERQGKVEKGIGDIKRGFELPLAMRLGEGQTIHLGDYNALLMEYALEMAEKRHPRKRRITRRLAFETSLRTYPPRDFSATVRQVACRVVTRQVDAYGCVWLDNQAMKVPQYVGASHVPTEGKRIRLSYNAAGEVVGELIEHYAKPFTLAPAQPNAIGDFSRAGAPTYRDRIEADVTGQPIKGIEKPGEHSGDGSIHALPPELEDREAASPMTAAETERDDRLTPHQARIIAGRRLEPTGVHLSDYGEVFAPLLQQEHIDPADLEKLLALVLADARGEDAPQRARPQQRRAATG